MRNNKSQVKIILFIILGLLVCINPSYSKDNSSQINDGKRDRFILPNGMTVILKEIHTAPVIAMQMWCKSGSITEDEYLGDGISHFVEHMLFKGTAKRKVNQIANEIREAGGELNAYTSFDRIVFHIVVTNRYFDTGLDCLADATMHSSFDELELQKERQVILKEVNMNEDDPNRVVSKLFWATAYTQHPYHYPVIGYSELVSKVTHDQLVDYYKKVFVPENLILVIAGDFSIEEAKPKIEQQFKDFEKRVIPKSYLPEEPPQIGLRKIVVEQDINQTYLEMGYHIPSITSEDVYPLDVLAIILGQGRSSRLYKEIQTQKGLVHSIDAYSWTPQYPGMFGISAVMDESNREKAEFLILEEIDKIKKGKVSEGELDKAKKSVESNHIFDMQTIQDQASRLGDDEMTVHDIDFSTKYIDRVHKVTAEDIQRVANKYFYTDNLTIAVLRPKQGDSSIPIKVKPEQTTTREKTQKFILPNGMTLLVQENPTLPIVAMRAVFKGGILYENEKNNGISNLMTSMLLKGTQKRNAEQIADELAAVGGKIDIYSGNNSFGISVDVLKSDVDLGLNILDDVIVNSTFPQAELQREKDRIIGSIRSKEDDPFTIASKLFRKGFFANHPYRFMNSGTIESVSGLNQEELIKFHDELCVPKNMVLAVYGDIKAEDIKVQIEKAFSKFQSSSTPQIPNIPESPITGIKKEEAYKDKSQAIVLIGYPGIDIKNNDRYTFDVLNSILSGQGARLFDTVREKQGLAYYVGAFNIIGLDPGSYVLYAGTVGEKVERVIDSLLHEVENLRTEGPTDEEISRAKKELIGNKAIDLQTNGAVAFEAGIDELYGLGYNNYLDYSDKIEKITKQEVQNIIQKYLKSDAYVLTVVRPPIKETQTEKTE